ncbi:hypothetical protein AB0L40_05810 [Patulibacter sp. NPDC049589]|uniref:hypothetical protein n=1 Tax=Patulibacter sp. NPDC049589 TaxID=3154731 RepID=UPI0034359A6B
MDDASVDRTQRADVPCEHRTVEWYKLENERLLEALRVREARVARMEDDLVLLAERSETLDRIVSGGWWRLRLRLMRLFAVVSFVRRGLPQREMTVERDPLSRDALASRAERLRSQTDRLSSGLPVSLHRHAKDSSVRRVICSLADENYLGPLSICSVGLEQYATRHGWDVAIHVGSLDLARPIAWSKLLFVSRLLEQYEEVWWVDADAVIVDTAPDIASLIDVDKDLYIVEHRWDEPSGRRAVNSGVVLFRRSDWTTSLIEAIWHREEFIDHPWWENTAMLDLFGYQIPDDGTPPIPGVPTAWMDRVKLIGLEWNSTENASAAVAPVIRHIGRRPTVAVLEQMMTGELRRANAVGVARET